MNISIYEFKSLENKLLDKVLYFALSPNYLNEVDDAKNYFTKILNENDYLFNEMNFTSWLLWDYKLKSGKGFFEEYIQMCGSKLTDEEQKIMEALSDTYLSIYENVVTNGKRKLIDIFSKKEFIIQEDSKKININELLIGKIVSYAGKSYLLDEYYTLDKRFQNGIEKTFHEKYEESRNKDKFLSTIQFIKNNSILLYSFAHIIDDISRKQIENSADYSVFQSTYIVLNNKRLYENLMNNQEIELDYKENDVMYFIMYRQGKKRVLCEIVLYKDKLEVECTSDIDKVRAKKVLEKLAGDLIRHVRDGVLTIDDIL